MKKLMVLAAVLATASGLAWADAVTGTSPVTHNVTFTVIIPGRLGINIPTVEHNWTLDLTLNPLYPPAAATPFVITNNATVQILSNNPYTYSYTASMTTSLTNLTVNDFQYEATGWIPSWAGWQTFAASGTFQTGLAGTAGWENRNMMYRVNLDGTEDIGTGIMTLVHIITQP